MGWPRPCRASARRTDINDMLSACAMLHTFSLFKLQISQNTDFHLATYRFSFRQIQILTSQITDVAKYGFSLRNLIKISQNTDFHFVS